jgi:LacI family transcriptional regulator
MARRQRDRSYPPTMRDVAELARVSPMTVSRVLRDEPQVGSDARQRVLAAVGQLGYRRNEVARGLRLGRKTGLIGLVVTNLANPFYAQLALGIEDLAAEHDLRIVLGNTGEDPRRERELVENLVAHRVDGLIVVPAGTDHAHLAPAALGDVPVVFAARPPSGIVANCVLVDDFAGARAATARLLTAGHRRVAFLGNPPAVYTGAERFRGFCAAFDEAGLTFDEQCVRRKQQDVAAAERAASEVLALSNPPTAIFSTNNRNALGAIRAVKKLRTSTTIAAFDDFELADVLGLPLVVVSYDSREIGRQALRLLLQELEDPGTEIRDDSRRIVLPVSLTEHGDITPSG